MATRPVTMPDGTVIEITLPEVSETRPVTMPDGTEIEITLPVVSGGSSSGSSRPSTSTPSVRFAVDVSLTEKSGGSMIIFPWNPEKIQYRSGEAVVATFDILKKGPVDLPMGTGLKEVEWDGIFPGIMRTDTTMLHGSQQKPEVYKEQIEYWKANGTVLTILVTNYPINFDCYVKDFTCEATGGFGDLEYHIHLVEKKDINILAQTEETQQGGTTEGSNTKRPPKKFETYITVSGDTLWKIAQRFLGNGARWEEIYEANANALDQEAAAHGVSNADHQAIFPGIALTIVIEE